MRWHCRSTSLLHRLEASVGYLLTFFLVEHTSALDRAVVKNSLVELPSTGRFNRLGGRGLTALDRKNAENLDSLLREGPRREQCA
jgi:hypothetical protein